MIKVNLKRLPCRIRGTGNFLRTFAVWLKKNNQIIETKTFRSFQLIFIDNAIDEGQKAE